MQENFQKVMEQAGLQNQDKLNAKEAKKWRHVNLNGTQYSYKTLGGRKGISVALKLKQLFLPLLGSAVDGLRVQEDTLEVPQTFTQLAYILVNQMDSVDVEALIFDNLLHTVMVNGEIVDVDDYFDTNYEDIIPLLAHVVKENFESFFTGNGMMKTIISKIGEMVGETMGDISLNGEKNEDSM